MDREALLSALDDSLAYWREFEGNRYRALRRKAFERPGVLGAAFLYDKVFRSRIDFQVNARLFFGPTLRTMVTEPDVLVCGAKAHSSESRLTRLLIRELESGDVFLDVGAHHGFFALLAEALVGREGAVHAFEPAAPHFHILERNTRSYPNISINPTALFSSEGPLKFYENMKEGSTINKAFYAKDAMSRGEKFYETTVKAMTLDRYCKDRGVFPTFWKLDVEGAEYDVLLGGAETLRKSRPKIVLEVWRSPLDNTNHLKAVAFLVSEGFRCYRIGPSGLPEPLSDIVPDRDILPEARTDNFLFMKP